MARINNGLLNGFSGKIGNVVSCYRYGKYYLRMRPEKVHHPNSEKQLAQRMRFTLIQQFMHPISPFLRFGFGAYAVGRSAYNAAMSYNLEHALKGIYPEIMVDYQAARISKGKLPGIASGNVCQGESGKLIFTWERQVSSVKSREPDKAVVVILCPETKEAIWFMDTIQISAFQIEIVIPNGMLNKEILCYLCFIKSGLLLDHPSENNISDSFYCGSVVTN